jgi:hypothetical protein
MCVSVRSVSGPRPLSAPGAEARIAELWGQLGEEDRVALLSALGSGLLDARWAAQAVTQPGNAGLPGATVLAALGRAIQELSRAQELLAVQAEGAA